MLLAHNPPLFFTHPHPLSTQCYFSPLFLTYFKFGEGRSPNPLCPTRGYTVSISGKLLPKPQSKSEPCPHHRPTRCGSSSHFHDLVPSASVLADFAQITGKCIISLNLFPGRMLFCIVHHCFTSLLITAETPGRWKLYPDFRVRLTWIRNLAY